MVILFRYSNSSSIKIDSLNRQFIKQNVAKWAKINYLSCCLAISSVKSLIVASLCRVAASLYFISKNNKSFILSACCLRRTRSFLWKASSDSYWSCIDIHMSEPEDFQACFEGGGHSDIEITSSDPQMLALSLS